MVMEITRAYLEGFNQPKWQLNENINICNFHFLVERTRKYVFTDGREKIAIHEQTGGDGYQCRPNEYMSFLLLLVAVRDHPLVIKLLQQFADDITKQLYLVTNAIADPTFDYWAMSARTNEYGRPATISGLTKFILESESLRPITPGDAKVFQQWRTFIGNIFAAWNSVHQLDHSAMNNNRTYAWDRFVAGLTSNDTTY